MSLPNLVFIGLSLRFVANLFFVMRVAVAIPSKCLNMVSVVQ